MDGLNQAQFAQLVCCSKQLISKHGQAGRLVTNEAGRVRPKESLMRLEGHLDEGKRRAALLRLAGLPADFAGAREPPRSVDGDTMSPSARKNGAAAGNGQDKDNTVVEFRSWRVQKERADAMLREIELAERMGELVYADEVRAATRDIVATFWSEVDRGRRLGVDEIAGELGLDAAQAQKLRALIHRRERQLRENFGAAMQRMADRFKTAPGPAWPGLQGAEPYGGAPPADGA